MMKVVYCRLFGTEGALIEEEDEKLKALLVQEQVAIRIRDG